MLSAPTVTIMSFCVYEKCEQIYDDVSFKCHKSPSSVTNIKLRLMPQA